MGSGAIVLDVGRGEARLGDTLVEIRSAGDGRLRLGGASGPVLRPVTWSERVHAVALALVSARPRESLAEELCAAATAVAGDADAAACEVLALHLAGAGEPAPPFAEAALRVVQATGWSPEQLASADAAEVDRLATALAPAGEEGGWQVFLLGAAELADLRAELADDLLSRGERTTGPLEESAQSGRVSVARRTRRGGLDEAPPARARTAHATADRESRPSSPGGIAAVETETLVPAPRSAGDTVVLGRSSVRATAPVLDLPPPPDNAFLALGASELGRTAVSRPAGFRRLAPVPAESHAPAAGAQAGELATATPGPAPSGQAVTLRQERRWPELRLESRRPGGVFAVPSAPAVELADALAALLDDEADLRGLRR